MEIKKTLKITHTSSKRKIAKILHPEKSHDIIYNKKKVISLRSPEKDAESGRGCF